MAFEVPLDITEETICNIKPNSEYRKEMQEVKIIIWDEICMTSKYAMEVVDRLFGDLCNSNEIFGHKIIIVSGDFRQT